MKLIDSVKNILARLGPRGWEQLMERHGCHLGATDLRAELVRPLTNASGQSTIDRSVSGFQDFSSAGKAAIEPGDPARSLLYHALASPEVNPMTIGPRTDQDFPTLMELDTIENYIYSLANKRLADFTDPVVAVFAYHYRTAGSSVHGIHADMAYSRTGISRVGTTGPHYDSLRRSFWGVPTGGAPGVSVMPARFAAFIAERRKLSAKDSVVHPLNGPLARDAKRIFLIPIHKLFSGSECLVGENVDLSFSEYHRSEKLRKLHMLPLAKGGVSAPAGFNINRTPYIRESQELVTLQPAGASTLLISNPTDSLVQPAKQLNTQSGKQEFVRFVVPPLKGSVDNPDNRFPSFSSFQVPAPNDRRAAPEYASIRLHVTPAGQLFDLSALDSARYEKVLRTGLFTGVPGVPDGPLTAAHLLDQTCEGIIHAQPALSKVLNHYGAVSFVAAPDFLPLVGQIDVQRWAERNKLLGTVFFSRGAPEPLCYGRDVTPNPALLDPTTHAGAGFDRSDAANLTITALLSKAPSGQGTQSTHKTTLATTWLTDAAADVFEPGWDASMFQDNQGDFYANFGLGSPFPEDAKLCAALNSFWPAAAPDTGRTFGQMTALPLLDEELGLHPQHPKVLAGQSGSQPGWDGEFGPFFTSAGKKVSFTWIERSDYSMTALNGKMNIGLLGRIDSPEQIGRMDAFRECADRIRGNTKMTDFSTLLVTAEKIEDWSQRPDRFGASLTGPGYLYVFADFKNAVQDPAEPKRRIAIVTATFTCQVTRNEVGLKKNDGQPVITAWLHPQTS